MEATPSPEAPVPPFELCIATHTRLVVDGHACECYVQFYGELCQYTYDSYYPFVKVMDILGLLTLLYSLLWGALKAIQIGRHFSFKKMSHVALLLNMFGCVGRIMFYLVSLLADQGLTYGYKDAELAPVIALALGLIVAVASWVAASSLILGSWFTLLEEKDRPELAAKTKITVIVMACITLICYPGIYLNLGLNIPVIGSVLVFTPLGFDLVGMIVILLMIKFMRSKMSPDGERLPDTIAARKNYAIRGMTANVCSWFFFLLAIVLFNRVTTPSSYAYGFVFPANFLQIGSEFALSLTIMFLIDRQGGVPALIRWFLCGVPLITDIGESSSQSQMSGFSSHFSVTATFGEDRFDDNNSSRATEDSNLDILAPSSTPSTPLNKAPKSTSTTASPLSERRLTHIHNKNSFNESEIDGEDANEADSRGSFSLSIEPDQPTTEI